MTRPDAGTPAPPLRPPQHRRQRRIWLGAAILLVVLVAAGMAAVAFLPAAESASLGPLAPTPTPVDATAAPVLPSASASASPSAKASAKTRPSRSPRHQPAPSPTGSAGTGIGTPTRSGWPNASNTGTPDNVTLHSCGIRISSSGTYDQCQFNGDVTVVADNVKITRSLINGSVNTGSQHGLVISDTTIDCHCLADGTQTPPAIMESNYTLLRVNIFNAGHGAAAKNNVTIQDSYIHGLGANNEAHKDGIYAGDGSNVVIRHNNITCNDGSAGGCTSAIGLLDDFSPISNWVIDNNLLNTNGSYCFYGSGGPQKQYSNNRITFTNNHFGRTVNQKCGYYGPVTYFQSDAPGNVWSGNVWADTGEPVGPSY